MCQGALRRVRHVAAEAVRAVLSQRVAFDRANPDRRVDDAGLRPDLVGTNERATHALPTANCAAARLTPTRLLGLFGGVAEWGTNAFGRAGAGGDEAIGIGIAHRRAALLTIYASATGSRQRT